MENLKKGDIVEVVSHKGISDLGTIFIKVNHKYEVGYTKENTVFLCYPAGWIGINVNSVKKIGESQMQYEESNRYKLAQAIKKTGFSAKALSRAVAGNESYFYNKTGVARFNKKGDISDETLNLALTDLAFAEREVLGIGAKTVEDENHISKETNSIIYREAGSKEPELYTAVINSKGDVVDIVKASTVDTQSDAEIQMVDFAKAVDISVNHDDQADAASYAIKKLIENQERNKIKPTSNKPLFIGAAVVIFITLILFILNNYLQVV